jgi:Phosphotransferase enzyme family
LVAQLARRTGTGAVGEPRKLNARLELFLAAGSIEARSSPRHHHRSMVRGLEGPPVWVHGDIAEGNLLVKDGQLCAVIDFGCAGIGDPSCDLVIAWTFLDPASRASFRAAIALDPATWERARGWAIWKALITPMQHRHKSPTEAIVGDLRPPPS